MSTANKEWLLRGYSGRLFVASSIGWMALQTGRHALSPLLPVITTDLGISSFEAGIALSLMWALYAICHYPGGRFSDKLSQKTVLIASLIILLVGFSALFVTEGYLAFLISVAIVGIGTGLYFISMRTLVTRLFVRKRGQAFGINMALGNGGAVLAAGFAIFVVELGGWRVAFVPIIIVLLAVLILLHSWSQEAYVVSRVDLELTTAVWRVLGDRRTRRLLVVYSLFIFVWQGVITFLPMFLQVTKAFPTTLASGGFGLLYATGMVAMPVAGSLGDRLSQASVTIGSLLLSAVGLTAVIVVSTPILVVLGVIVFSVGLMSCPPVMQAYVMDRFSDESIGSDFGTFKGIYTGLGSLGPAYVGFVASIASYEVAFVGFVVCLAVSAMILAWMIL